MATYSIFTFNGENAILKLHLSILSDYVDKFIIIEANKTFSGQPKPLYLMRDYRYFKHWWKKIDYYMMTHWDDVALWDQAIKSPNTEGADHWKREFYVKESIHKALKNANVKDDDTLFIGDVDEIIDPNVKFESEGPIKAKLRVYNNYLNNRSSEEFWGTLICQYKDIKDKCLNHVRSDPSIRSKGKYLGWHFTSMGGIDEIRRKLISSYDHNSYKSPEEWDNFLKKVLPKRFGDGVDIWERPHTYTKDEKEWPEFLKQNREAYKSLLL